MRNIWWLRGTTITNKDGKYLATKTETREISKEDRDELVAQINLEKSEAQANPNFSDKYKTECATRCDVELALIAD